MSLNIAMIILLGPDHDFLLGYARQLLDYFIKQFQTVYGKHYLTHNVYGMFHLCDDYEQFGPLDNCSSFMFVNYMKKLKSLLQKNKKLL